jgi:hypothetical protein
MKKIFNEIITNVGIFYYIYHYWYLYLAISFFAFIGWAYVQFTIGSLKLFLMLH